MAASASKRAKLTCSLCDATMTESYGHHPAGIILCGSCDDFTEDGAIDIAKAVMHKEKKPANHQHVMLMKAEYEKNKQSKNVPDFPQETVYEEVTQVSELQERHRFLSREKFKLDYGAFPDVAKASQVKVVNRHNEEVSGVAVALDEDPTLVISTQRKLVRLTPILDATDHLFQEQAALRFQQEMKTRRTALGWKSGNKYQAKQKSIPVYTHKQLKDLAAAVLPGEPTTALSGLSRGSSFGPQVLCSGSDGSDLEEVVDPDQDSQALTKRRRSTKPAASPQSRASEAHAEEAASDSREIPADVASRRGRASSRATDGKPARRGRAASGRNSTSQQSTTPCRSRSRSSKRWKGLLLTSHHLAASAALPAPGDEASSAGTASSIGKEGRNKPASYWFQVLTPGAVWAEHPWIGRWNDWALDCANREAGEGKIPSAQRLRQHHDMIAKCVELRTQLADDSVHFGSLKDLIQELIDKDVDFDSRIRCKLLAKRLKSMISDMQAEGSSKDVGALAVVLVPFDPDAVVEDDSSDGEGQVTDEHVQDCRSEEAFLPSPALSAYPR